MPGAAPAPYTARSIALDTHMPDIEDAATPAFARSPCIDVCRMHRTLDVCIGCFRTLEEISAWSSMSVEEKQAVLAELPARRSLVPPPRTGR